MNILINMQSFHNDTIFEEISKISLSNTITDIWLVSSLMHNLDDNTIRKYRKILKVKYINTNSLFSNCFSNIPFELDNTTLMKQSNLYSSLLSSSRWIPIFKRDENDASSFSMNLYYDVYNFWNNFFQINKIDAVISLQAEHSSLDKILIKSAKENGVKNILSAIISGWQASINEEYFAIFDNLNEKFIALDKYNIKQKSTNYDYNTKQIHSNKYKGSKLNNINIKFNVLKSFLGSNISLNEKLILIKEKIFNIFNNKILLNKQLKYIKSLKKYYETISINDIDYKNKYIYYCLHFDPEATTLPKDTIHSNQLLNIRIIASALPDGWKMYVKEHPHQLNSDLYKNIFLNQLHAIDLFRSNSFYNYVNQLKNVHLVSLSINHKELIENAEYIASNTGTVFREATQLNKRCLTFSSKSIYTLLNNIYQVGDYDSCQRLFLENPQPLYQDVDKLFEEYTLTINDINQRDAILLSFIIENKLYKVNHE